MEETLAEAGRVFRCMLDKAYFAMNQPLRVILEEAQKEKRRAVKNPQSSRIPKQY